MPTSTVTLVEGMQFVADFGSGHAIVMDGPADFGGHDTGPRPMELLLAGLGGCTGMDVASILRKKRQPFTGLKVDIVGTKAEEHPSRYTKIVVNYEVRGRGVSDAAVQQPSPQVGAQPSTAHEHMVSAPVQNPSPQVSPQSA